jgi:cyclase
VKVPVVANGGARSMSDFLLAVQSGASAVAAGSRFVYSGKEHGILINYPSQAELQSEVFSKF